MKYLSLGSLARDAELPAILEFPALERLRLYPGPNAAQIIALVEAPHLKYLSLGQNSDLPTTGQFPALRCLEATASEQLLAALGGLPLLEEILIVSSDQTSDLKSALDVLVQRNEKGEAALLPNLRQLKCEYAPHLSGVIGSLIERRNGGGQERRGWHFTVGLHRRASYHERALVEFLKLHPHARMEIGDVFCFDDFLPSK